MQATEFPKTRESHLFCDRYISVTVYAIRKLCVRIDNLYNLCQQSVPQFPHGDRAATVRETLRNDENSGFEWVQTCLGGFESLSVPCVMVSTSKRATCKKNENCAWWKKLSTRKVSSTCVSDSLVNNDSLFTAPMTIYRYLGNESSQRFMILNTPGSHRDLRPLPTESQCGRALFRCGRPNASGREVEYLRDPGTWNVQTW